MTFNWGIRNQRTQSRILGLCGNDRIFNTNSINPFFYYILNDRILNTNSINPFFYYILNMEMKSQSLSNFCMELQAPACHNNSQVHLLQHLIVFQSQYNLT